MITVAKHVIILVSIRSLATPYAGPHKLFKIFLKLPRCIFTVAERKQPNAVISFGEWNWKSCSAALQFRTPFDRFFSLLSHVHLRHFSFILNHKTVKCLQTFEIQNTANVVAIDEIATYDYSLVRICLNANIHTFLFINRWYKAKQPSLMRGRWTPIHKNSTMGSTFKHVCLEHER